MMCLVANSGMHVEHNIAGVNVLKCYLISQIGNSSAVSGPGKEIELLHVCLLCFKTFEQNDFW